MLEENSSNTNLKLSNVFTLYYKGASFLRTGITLLSTPSKEFFTSSNRWKAFSKHFGFYRKDTSGNYFWVPDNATEWNKVMADYSVSNPTGRDYENRLFGFAEFWNTTINKMSYSSILSFSFKEFVEFSLNLFSNKIIPNDSVVRYNTSGNFNGSGSPQDIWVKNQTNNFLQISFISYLKNKTI